MLPSVAIVMAAGKGTRMKSELPKVLVPLNGRPMVEFVLDAIRIAGIERVVVVVGYRADLVREALGQHRGIDFVEQSPQLGTGHAVMVCRDVLKDHKGPILVLTGDTPLVQPATLRKMLDEFARAQPACLLGTAEKANPTGLGRVVRDRAGNFSAIVEEKDATAEQKSIREVNMSYYLFDSRELWHALDRVRNDNAQGEYYLTDCPGILKQEDKDVRALCALVGCETLSINTPAELAEAERELTSQK
ncbi:MAG: NTP transferase domain-containing protein [Pirellulales bacterium]|nr:NTP transferase domain-containing protein [Pirellulales bacterium]